MASTVKTILVLLVALVLLIIGFKVLVAVLGWAVKMAFLALLLLALVALLSKVLRHA